MKWIIFGFVVLNVIPVIGQILHPATDRMDSLFYALDTTPSNYRVIQIADDLLQMIDTSKSSKVLYDVYRTKGLSQSKTGDLHAALASQQAAHQIAYQLQDSFLIAQSSYSIGRIQYLLGQLELAHQHFQTAVDYLKLQDSLGKIVANTPLEEWSITYETQMAKNQAAIQQREIETLKQEKKLNHLSNFFIISLLMLALMVSSFFFVRNRMKRKLAESELRNQKLVAQQFRQELQGKQKDLTNLALEIARKNELFIKTNKTLLEIDLESLPAEQRRKLQQLIQFNTNQLRINEDLEELLVNIEQVNTDFFEKLNKLAPELTPSEKQICAFLRLNLSNKEIASIRNISPKSVEMARYRLRKKLPIQTGDDIYQFIQSI